MSGSIQSEYECDSDMWLRTVEELDGHDWYVQRRERELRTNGEFLEINKKGGSGSGVWVTVSAISASQSKVQMIWIVRSSRQIPLDMVELALFIEKELLKGGAICLGGAVEPIAKKLKKGSSLNCVHSGVTSAQTIFGLAVHVFSGMLD
jgi:hypothetical protein